MKGGKREKMDQKKIGGFLKMLRKEKGLTQEQLAEILNVSGRTVSRWETGTNLPDLSILIQLAEYYNIEIKELLNGERKSENMDNELKDTLLKVADYSELQKRKAAKAGNLAFGIMFAACALVIIIQMLVTGNLSLVVGETVILVIGGIIYTVLLVRSGAWETGTILKSTPKNNLITSLICSGVFAVIFFFMMKKNADFDRLLRASICFFIVFTVVSYAVLRVLAFFSRKREDSLKKENVC